MKNTISLNWKAIFIIATLTLLLGSCKTWLSDRGIHQINKIPVDREASVRSIERSKTDNTEILQKETLEPSTISKPCEETVQIEVVNSQSENYSAGSNTTKISDNKKKAIKAQKINETKNKKQKQEPSITFWILAIGGSLLAGSYAFAAIQKKRKAEDGCGICGIVLVILLIILISTLIVNLL